LLRVDRRARAAAGCHADAPLRFSMESERGAALVLSHSLSVDDLSVDDADAPRKPRASVAASSAHAPPRRHIDTDALLRREYRSRLVTQLVLSCGAPALHFFSCAARDATLLFAGQSAPPLEGHAAPRLHASLRLLCCALSLCLLALAALSKACPRLPPRWQPGSEALLRRLIRLEARSPYRAGAAPARKASAAASPRPRRCTRVGVAASTDAPCAACRSTRCTTHATRRR
jgi:hypothetical protein